MTAPTGPTIGGGSPGAAGPPGASGADIIDISDVDSSKASDVLANGVTYVPLVQGASDTIAFQFVCTRTGTWAFRFAYVMSAANGGNVRFQADFLAVGDGENPAAALVTGTPFVVTPGNDTNMHTLDEGDSGDLDQALTAGDTVRVKITRTAHANDTHTGDVRVLGILAVFLA